MAKRNKEAKKASSSTRSYLEGLGVVVSEDDLKAPPVDAIEVGIDRPTQWIDKSGQEVPRDLELYRVDTTVGSTRTDQVLRAKESEGFVALPAHSGFRWRGLSQPDQEVIMIRTDERRTAWEQARELKRKRQLGRKRNQLGVPMGGDGELVQEIERREVGVSPPSQI